MSNRRLRALFVLLLLTLVGFVQAEAQDVAIEPMAPDAFLGYPLGDEFTPPDRIVDFAQHLAESSPSVQLMPYGTTPEGRPLIQMVIARPDHLARLDEIFAINAELTAGGTSTARANEIAASNPAVVYFSYGVHGDESSSSEAAMWTAWDLAGGNSGLAAVLDSLVVIIDPVANPDGRSRYVEWFRSVAAATPNPDPQSREHRPPWPGGRFNHYLFDLNRDWAWATQPETQARLATWWRFNPQVHVDFHEMDPNSSYFFFPAAPPINPIYPDHILEWGRRFGMANALAFDANGWRYYTGESYDMLYPGYGDSWPSLHGAIGMTYEQAGGGRAGLSYGRTDGDTLTLEDRAMHHRTSGSATLLAAARGKSRLLLDFAAAHRTAGVDEPDFLLVPANDGKLEELTRLLALQHIEYSVARSPFSLRATPYPGVAARSAFPVGTVRVSPRQPRGRLALTLLQAETPLVGEFSYDISAWSLPYAYGVEAHRGLAPAAGGWVRSQPPPPAGASAPLAGYGYLLAPSERATAGVVTLATDGVDVMVLGASTRFGGREWPAGSWFIPVGGQSQVASALTDAGIGDLVVPIESGLSQGGPDIGSETTRSLQIPSLAVLAGERMSPTSVGAAWFYLEQRVGMPFTMLLREDLTSVDLSDYEVIVLPDMGGSFNEEEQGALRGWIEAGGRIVASAGGAEAVAGMLEMGPSQSGEPAEETDSDRERRLATREQRELAEWEQTVPGAIIEVELDPDHPISWGAGYGIYNDQLFVLHSGNQTYLPRPGAEAVAVIPAQPERISGEISDLSLGRLARSAWLLDQRVGAGEVILFADDPLFRMFWRSTEPLFFNAIVYGG